jgi:hypothetical protein
MGGRNGRVRRTNNAYSGSSVVQNDTVGQRTAGSGESGTNDIHGSAFEFFRNADLNARNFFNHGVGLDAGPKGAFHQNQFGGTVGGPILRKTKSSFSWTIRAPDKTQGQNVNTQVPTAADQEGNIGSDTK